MRTNELEREPMDGRQGALGDGLAARQSIIISLDYRNKLAEICQLTRRPMAEEIRLLIDRRAVEVGLEPVFPVHEMDTYRTGKSLR